MQPLADRSVEQSLLQVSGTAAQGALESLPGLGQLQELRLRLVVLAPHPLLPHPLLSLPIFPPAPALEPRPSPTQLP